MSESKRGVVPIACASLVIGIAACGGSGSASVDGTIGDRELNFSTVFGWIDATEIEYADDGWGEAVGYKRRDDPRLHLVYSGASFDPEQDFRFIDFTEKLELMNETIRKGFMSLRMRRTNKATAGQTYQAPASDGTGADDPRLELRAFSFALHELADDDDYPSKVQTFGSIMKIRLDIKTLGKEAGETVEGTVEIIVETHESDPTDAQVGSMTIDFVAPLISERIAECNDFNGNVRDFFLDERESACETSNYSTRTSSLTHSGL